MSKLDLVISHIDSGKCRIYYKDKNNKRTYCIQDDSCFGGSNFDFYECSNDGEPSHSIPWRSIKCIDDPIIKFPDDVLAQEVSGYIASIGYGE
jgi:hypothetical protein